MQAALQALEALGGLASAKVVVGLSLTGTLTMAIIQIVKDMTPVRRAFQRRWIKSWVDSQIAKFGKPTAHGAAVTPPDAAAAERTLVDLATGGDSTAFYDLAADQLVGQMSAASQITLDYPQQYGALLKVLAAGAAVADIGEVCQVASPRGVVAHGAALPADYTDARSRVGHRIQRNLDGLQISMSDRWQLWLQWVSLIVSIVLIEFAIWWQADFVVGPGLIGGFFLGIVGGYLAPVTRDIVAALQNLRNP